MAGSQIERVFSVLESLTSDPRGLPMQTLAEQLDIPKSATHRMLAELIRLGYVRQNPENLRYHLSTKLVAMGFRYLSSSGADIVQPVLDRLAQETGELVRLGVIDGERQTWIAKSQGPAPACVTTRTWAAMHRCLHGLRACVAGVHERCRSPVAGRTPGHGPTTGTGAECAALEH
jgi:DNA-binding IclR family transcriptional regulator